MARTQFKVTFTNAQPGAPVSILMPSVEHVFSTATAVKPVGGKQLYLDATNSITVWSDAQDVIAQTVDGAGLFIQGTATVASPTVTVGDGTAPTNPAGSAASSAPVQSTQTGTTYTLVLSDANTTVRCTNAGAVTVTVPPSASVVWVAGTIINVRALGAAGVTIAAGAGVTIQNNASALVQYQEVSLAYDATDSWIRVG